MTEFDAETPVLGWWYRLWRAVVVTVLVARTAAAGDRSREKSRSADDDPETVYLGRGFAGRLDCEYTANPPATVIVWLKNGHVIDPDSRVKVSKAGSLLIRAAEVGDEGQYACAVYSPSGSTESSPVIQLLVRGKNAFRFVS